MSLQPINPKIKLQEGDTFMISNLDPDLAKDIELCHKFGELMVRNLRSGFDRDAIMSDLKGMIGLVSFTIYEKFGEVYNVKTIPDQPKERGDTIDTEGLVGLEINIRESTIRVQDLPSKYLFNPSSVEETIDSLLEVSGVKRSDDD
tara:strand:+ start:9659 stop:10096 length:438 start_codon:yes stop_codon:yes gene_type:complete